MNNISLMSTLMVDLLDVIFLPVFLQNYGDVYCSMNGGFSDTRLRLDISILPLALIRFKDVDAGPNLRMIGSDMKIACQDTCH